MIPATSKRRPGPPFVSESAFEYLHVEIIKYVQKQYAVHKFIKEGFNESDAVIQSRAYVAAKLDSMGFDVGYRLGERYSKDTHFLQVDRLSLIKYFCLHIWTNVFGKHVDKLRSDSNGLYVLHECSFPWISQISCASEAEADWKCRPYTQLAVGIVRGALTNLGLAPEVCLEFDFSKSETKPGCLFYIVDHNHPRQLLRQRQILDRDIQARFEENLRDIQMEIQKEEELRSQKNSESISSDGKSLEADGNSTSPESEESVEPPKDEGGDHERKVSSLQVEEVPALSSTNDISDEEKE